MIARQLATAFELLQNHYVSVRRRRDDRFRAYPAAVLEEAATDLSTAITPKNAGSAKR
jgi:hypothetical protein